MPRPMTAPTSNQSPATPVRIRIAGQGSQQTVRRPPFVLPAVHLTYAHGRFRVRGTGPAGACMGDFAVASAR